MNHLEVLSIELKIPLWQLEVTLNLPISNDINLTSIGEAADLYRKTEGHGSEAKAIALHHWCRLCDEALERATTADEIRKIYTISPGDEVTRGKILLKRLALADCFEEIQAVLGQSSSNLKVSYAAHEKWKELTREAIINAGTVAQALFVYRSAPSHLWVKGAALERCLQLAVTTTDAKRVCLETNATSECREKSLRHWLSLATTTKELQDVLGRCFKHTDIRNEVLLKIIRLHELVEA